MTAKRRSMSADGFAAHQPPAKPHLADVAIGDVVLVGAGCPVESIGSDWYVRSGVNALGRNE